MYTVQYTWFKADEIYIQTEMLSRSSSLVSYAFFRFCPCQQVKTYLSHKKGKYMPQGDSEFVRRVGIRQYVWSSGFLRYHLHHFLTHGRGGDCREKSGFNIQFHVNIKWNECIQDFPFDLSNDLCERNDHFLIHTFMWFSCVKYLWFFWYGIWNSFIRVSYLTR